MKKYYSALIFLFLVSHSFAWNTPTIVSPSSGSSTWTGIELDWASVIGSDFYHLEVDTSSNFDSPILLSVFEAYINSSSFNNDTDEFVTDLIFGETYFWRVRAGITGDTSAWTSVQTFVTNDFVTLNGPADGAIIWTGTEFDWLSHDGVDFYEIQVDTSSNFNSPAFQNDVEAYTNTSDFNNDTDEFISDMLFGENYFWRVRAINAVDTSGWTTRTVQTRDFVTLNGPADGAIAWTGTEFDWLSHDGVDFYEIQVDTSSNFNSPTFQNDIEAYINTSDFNNDTEEFIDNMLFGETYFWRVRAINAADTSEWTTRSIQTRDFVTLNSPADLATNVSTTGINLDWLAHHGVDFYELEWDTTNLFNSGLLQSTIESYINTSNFNNDTDQSTGALLTNTVYFWRVRAMNAVDTSAWTSWAFSTGSTPILIPQVPTLLTPTNNATMVSNPVNFDWTDANDAAYYEHQYSLSSTFSSAISTNTTTPSNFSTSGLLIDTVYYWRVRSVNNGYNSNWSSTWAFDTYNCTATTSTTDITNCESYNWNGTTYSTSGTYTNTIPNSQGCDSIMTLNLTILNSTAGTDTQIACSSYTWLDGNTYTASNNSATFTLTNAEGCDSIVTLDLTINPVDVNTITSGIVLTATATGASFQWIDCSTNSPVAGATNQSFIPAANGDYAVVVTQNNCSDTSACITVSSVGVDELSSNQFVLFPNPSVNGQFKIESTSAIQSVEIYDLFGRKVLTVNPSISEFVDASMLVSGEYIVKIITEQTAGSVRFIKLK